MMMMMMQRWVREVNEVRIKCKEAAASFWAFGGFVMHHQAAGGTLTNTEEEEEEEGLMSCCNIPALITNILLASFTCIIALGGAAVGTVVGAMKGQTTETGFLRGSIIGAVAGAITCVQLLESIADGDQLSKVALLNSVVSGKVFMEWVGPAVLKAYQFQMRAAMETTYTDMAADLFYDDDTTTAGLTDHCIQTLPHFTFSSSGAGQQLICCCSICLQDVEEGEAVREVPSCGHCFHLDCLDQWLIRNASCPMCRTTYVVCSE